MSNDQNTYDQIEAYLKGKLSDADKVAFEKAMAEDADLKKEVKLQQASRDVLRHDYAMELSQLIQEKGNTYQPSSPIKWWGIGGAALGLLLIGVLVWQHDEEPNKTIISSPETTHEEVVADNSESSTAQDSPKGSNVLREKDSNTPLQQEQEKINDEAVEEGNVYVTANDTTVTEQTDKTSEKEALAHADKEEANNSKEPTNQTVNCDNKPAVTYTVEAAHQGHQDGVVTISNKSDMYLQYALIPGYDNYSGNRVLEGLEAGMYQLKAKSEDCEFEIAILDVPETSCQKTKDYTFNTAYESDFSLPLPQESAGKLMIVHKSGVEVWNKVFDKNESLSWNGMDKNGVPAQEGLHKIIVKTAQETCVYNVVVAK